MYVAKKNDGKTYVYVRDGKTYVNTLCLEAVSGVQIFRPSGVSLKNAPVVVNGITHTTDANGKVFVNGEKGKRGRVYVEYGDDHIGEVNVVYGEDAQVTLTKLYLLKVNAESGKYYYAFTITTNVGGTSYVGSIERKVPSGTSVTVKSVGRTVGDWQYYDSFIILDGTNTKKESYTFTMDTAHEVTFTDGSNYYVGQGT